MFRRRIYEMVAKTEPRSTYFQIPVKINSEEIVRVYEWFLRVEVVARSVDLLPILPDDAEH